VILIDALIAFAMVAGMMELLRDPEDAARAIPIAAAPGKGTPVAYLFNEWRQKCNHFSVMRQIASRKPRRRQS